MKSALPWVLVVLLLGGSYYLYSAGAKKDADIAQLKQQTSVMEQLQADSDELKKLQGQQGDVARLRKDNEDLPRLRGEVQQLRKQVEDLTKKLTMAQTQGSQLQAQQQQMAAENQELKNKAQQDQQAAAQAALQVAGQRQAAICMLHLRQLDAAKQRWAQDTGKGGDAVPTPEELAPYLPQNAFPTCPAGGNYSLNAVQAHAACSVQGHALQ